MKYFSAFYWGFFCLIGLVGFFACLDVGVGADEEAEAATLAINLSAIAGIFSGELTPYKTLITYVDRYYGIGFQIPAAFIGQFFQNLLNYFSLSISIKNPIIFTHISVWTCFIGAAFLMRSLLYQLTLSRATSYLGALCFLLWPYLLGHALMNIKDIPFLFAWLLCTFISLPLLKINNHIKNKSLNSCTVRIIALSITTAWLLSIRISGILIFIQYACLFLSSWYFSAPWQQKRSAPLDNCLNFKKILIFSWSFTFFLVAFYPVAWHNPLEILHAISYMSHHPWVGTTLTAGRFISPMTKLYLYIPVWLFAKLPLIIIIGLILSPWIFNRKIKGSRANFNIPKPSLVKTIGLGLGIVIILLALLVMRVGLYNELRQLLFMFPILFLIGVTSLFMLNEKWCYVGLIITGIIFIWDNFILFPYNYSYLSEISRHRPAIQYFETDYFGFSAGRSARWLSKNPQYAIHDCIYAWPTHLLTYELNYQSYSCLADSLGHGRNIPDNKKNLLYVNQRNLINFHIPNQCKLIHSEERTLPFSRQPLIMGQLFSCN